VVSTALDRLAERCESIYVDVDVDVLDRAFAPACPGARPGGMTPRDLAEGVRVGASHQLVKWIDFVEVDAEADPDGATLDAMAHLFLAAVAGYAER
jgi:arginase family enzyme